ASRPSCTIRRAVKYQQPIRRAASYNESWELGRFILPPKAKEPGRHRGARAFYMKCSNRPLSTARCFRDKKTSKLQAACGHGPSSAIIGVWRDAPRCERPRPLRTDAKLRWDSEALGRRSKLAANPSACTPRPGSTVLEAGPFVF